MDIWTKEKRSQVMSRIRSSDTKPEKALRSALHTRGYRFRVNKKDLPGKPDIVLPKYKTVIFVHGCFWHFHQDCREGRIPSSNSEYWKSKLSKTVERDLRNKNSCEQLGWRVEIIWECQIENNLDDVLNYLRTKL